MTLDIQSLTQFRKLCATGAAIVTNPDGSWSERWKIDQTARQLIGEQFASVAPNFEKEDALVFSRFFLRYLQSREVQRAKVKIHFNNPTFDELHEMCEVLKGRLQKFIDQEKEACARLKAHRDVLQSELNDLPKPPSPVSTSSSLPTDAGEAKANAKYKALKAQIDVYKTALTKQESASLACEASALLTKQMIGLKYRALSQTQIQAAGVRLQNRSNQLWLKEEVILWKKQQFPLLSCDFTEDELRKVDETCLYPELIALFKENPSILEDYIAFVFRNTVNVCEDAVKIAVQFPTLQEQLTKSYLDKRVKRLRNYGLLFHEDETIDGPNSSSRLVKKDVTFLINGRYESILDQTKKITFSNTTVLTIREIFEEFAAKNKKMGRFEYLAQGITLAETQFPKVNLDSPDWWQELPEFEALSLQEVQERYRVTPAKDESLIVLKGSRQHTNLRTDNNHSWFEVVVEKKGTGKYQVLPIGKYATYYAQNLLDLFFFIFNTQPASICYPDENEFYYHREQCALPLVASSEHFARFMDKVRKDMILAKEGKIPFQSQGNNCATWLQETVDYAFFDKRLPRFFELDILETTGLFPVNVIVSTLNSIKNATTKSIANTCRIVFCTVICSAWRGYSPDWSHKKITFLQVDPSLPVFDLVNTINAILVTIYQTVVYASQLVMHLLSNTEDPAIRLKDNKTWLAGTLLLPSYLFVAAEKYQRSPKW